VAEARAAVDVGPALHPRVERVASRLLSVLGTAGVDAWSFVGTDGLRRVVAVRDTDAALARDALATAPAWHATVEGGPAGPLAEVAPQLGAGLTRVTVHDPDDLPEGFAVLGERFAAELQVWRTVDDDLLEAPGETPYGRYVRASRLHRLDASPPLDALTFPIDVVYTWVDDADQDWKERRARRLSRPFERVTDGAVDAARFRSRDELRYSLRSLAEFAPWVRHVYVVTDQQVPDWLADGLDDLTIVDHREIFADPGALPTFNSHAIEAQLHRVPGLAEHFLYLNDDFFLARPLAATTFFTPGGIPRFFLSRARIPWGDAVPSDPGVDAAAKNGRRIMQQRFGVRPVAKFKHVPQAMRRSNLEEIEHELPEAKATAHHPVRAIDDVSIPSSLAHHWASQRGRAVPGSIAYDYLWLGDLPRCRERADHLLAHRDLDAFCIADEQLDAAATRDADAFVHRFLSAYYPERSRFERTDAGAG
jgi:hypothetical protein